MCYKIRADDIISLVETDVNLLIFAVAKSEGRAIPNSGEFGYIPSIGITALVLEGGKIR